MLNRSRGYFNALFILFLGISLNSFSQIMHGGKPIGFSQEVRSHIPVIDMPAIDVQRLLEEDAANDNYEKVFKFAHSFEVDIDPNLHGTWTDVKNGRIWRVAIQSNGAYSLNFGFDQFHLPEGGRLFIYNQDHTDYIGALTHENNKPQGFLSTTVLKGDHAIIEYFEPANKRGQTQLHINRVSHDYANIVDYAQRAFGGSGSCNMNINCPDGSAWQTEKRSVAMIISGGSRACTGSLIADYPQSNTPYFLTANHCWSNQATTEAWVFMFNYESPDCNNTDGPTNQTVSNCTFRSRNPDSDFLLVELSSLPPQSYNPYISGFDKSGNIPPNTVGIHHPSGDIKKISFDDDAPGSGNMGTAVANAEWQIYAWDRSTTTEPGSSGSGLWDNNHRLIGQLHGGQATCANSINDYYGKISVSWDRGGTSTSQLKDWLDPSNNMTVVNTVDGYDPYAPSVANDASINAINNPTGSFCEGSFTPEVILQNKGTANLTSVSIVYDIDGGGSQTYTWTGNLASNETATVTLNAMTATAGAHTFNATTSLPNGVTDENTANDANSSSFSALAITAGQTLPFTEGFENATFPPTGWTLTNPESNSTWSRSTAASGFGGSTACAKMDFWSTAGDITGQSDYLDLPTLDLSTVSTPVTMDFSVAYARYGANNFDSLIVLVSTNCGENWTRVYADGNSGLATVADQTTEWTATAGDWASKTINLDTYAGQTGVLIRLEALSNWGNNLYLDDINITGTPAITASFNSDVTSVCPGGTVNFTDASSGSPTSWSWTFTGGSPATSTAQNPVVTFAAAGTYDVSLTVSDGTNNDTQTVTGYITVNDSPSTSSTAVNASCNGGTDGQAITTATGGTPVYTYSWDDPSTQTTATATGLAAGVYNVTITDANGCTTSDVVTVAEPTALTATATSTDASCGNTDGTATVTVSGGTSGYTYAWDDAGTQTTATATGLGAGTYNVVVTDANGCTTTTSADVMDTSGPTLTVSNNNVSCPSGTDGDATVSVTGGTPGYTYAWDDASTQTTATATGLTAGTYNIVVTDANGCSSSTSVTITEPAAFVTSATATDETCFGAADGTATVSVTGGTSGYTYAWDDPSTQTTATATGLTAGTYNVAITDANGCATSASATVSAPTALTLSASSNDISCFGNSDGDATVTVTGGTSPYTYAWDDAATQTTATATGLVAGTYNVVVTDANGCSDNTSITINEPVAISTLTTPASPSCAGGNDGSASVTASGGTGSYSYLWDDAATQTTAIATGLAAGTYNVTVTDLNGCSVSDVVTLTDPSAITLITSANNADCGNNNGDATVTASGGAGSYTYLWDDASSQTTATATSLLSGTYNVIVTDASGCTANASVTVNANGFTVNTSSTDASCASGTDGTVTATTTGGTSPFTYSWDDPSTQTTATATGLSAGTYNVVVLDANGCSSSASATVNEPTPIVVTTSVTDASCGNNDGAVTATATGGTGAYTYAWDDASTQTTATASGLGAGTFNVVVTDANGCTATGSGTVNNNSFTLSVTSNDVSCAGGNDGNATVTVAGGTAPFTYLWDDSFGQTTSSAINLSTGTYNVVVTDASSCSNNISVTISGSSVLASTTSSSNATCGSNNGIASVSVTGGATPYTYSWDDAAMQTTATATGLGTGVYMVTITDANGCTDVQTVTINNDEPIATATGTDVSCSGTNDGSATVTVTGGTSPYTYAWDDASTQTTATASGLSAGTYTVTVTDINGCITTASTTISSGSGLTLTGSSTDATCGGNDGTATVSVTGGTSPYTYAWDDASTQTTATATGLSAATYTVTVTDANSCTEIASVIVSNTVPNVTITSTDPTCNGANNGSATLTASGGATPYTYAWDDALNQTSATATNLVAGTYVGTVTDNNGCTASASVTLIESSTMTINTFSNDVSCDGLCDGFASVNVIGGASPYSYVWDDASSSTTSSISGLCMGTYSVIVADANGCQGASSVFISKPASIILSVTATDVDCNGDANGVANTTVTGGVAPYTFLWDDANNQTTASASGLTAGTYSVVITDFNGCNATQTVTINEPTAMVLTSTSTPDTCGSAVGTAMVSATGGVGSYTYSWSTISSTSNIVNGMSEGVYDCIVTDANGCTDITTVTITQLGGPSATVSADQEICAGNSAAVSATGGNSYYWSTGQTSSTIMVTPSTTSSYWVVALDNYGCYSDTVYTTVNVSSPPTTLITAPQTICAGESVLLEASGGTSFNWNTGATTQSITVSPNSTTTYSAIASNGSCQGSAASTTVTVVPSPSVTATSDITTAYLNNGATVMFDGTTTGGDQITWNFGDGFTSSSLSYAHQYGDTGVYVATLSVSNGYCTATDSIAITVLSSMNVEELDAIGVKIFPNPANEMIHLTSGFNGQDIQVNLYDTRGRLIVTRNMIDNGQMNISDFENGTYFMEVIIQGQRYFKNIVIIK